MKTSDFGEMRIVDTPLTEIGGIDVMSYIQPAHRHHRMRPARRDFL